MDTFVSELLVARLYHMSMARLLLLVPPSFAVPHNVNPVGSATVWSARRMNTTTPMSFDWCPDGHGMLIAAVPPSTNVVKLFQVGAAEVPATWKLRPR
jgi:hypothetical protein